MENLPTSSMKHMILFRSMHVLGMIESKNTNIGKRCNIDQAATYNDNGRFAGEITSKSPWGDPSQGIGTTSDEFYNINTTHASSPMSSRHKMRLRLPWPNSGPNQLPQKPNKQKWMGPLYLPGHVYNLLGQEAEDALQKYCVEAIEKFKSRTVHETRYDCIIQQRN